MDEAIPTRQELRDLTYSRSQGHFLSFLSSVKHRDDIILTRHPLKAAAALIVPDGVLLFPFLCLIIPYSLSSNTPDLPFLCSPPASS